MYYKLSVKTELVLLLLPCEKSDACIITYNKFSCHVWQVMDTCSMNVVVNILLISLCPI